MKYAVRDYQTSSCDFFPKDLREDFEKAGFSYIPACPVQEQRDPGSYSAARVFFNKVLLGTVNLVPMLNEGISLSMRIISLDSAVDTEISRLFEALPVKFNEIPSGQ